MVDEKTDFFKIVNNFSKKDNIPSIRISESKIEFKPKVTIAIPTFKRTDLLKEAIESAINQVGYSDYEIIVVDNNPERNCNTEKLMLTFSNSRLSYYKNSENLQMAGNWNRCFELAKGEYVVLLHDDDLLLPEFLKVGMNILTNNKDIGILKPRNYEFETQISQLSIDSIPKLNCKLNRVYDISFYYGQIIGVPSGMFYKKEYVLKIGGYNQDFFPNLDYCFNVLFADHYNITFLNQYLSLYRIFENESYNISTLEGFAKNDYFLITQLLNKYKVPKLIVKRYLCHRTKRCTEQNNRLWNKNFIFNMSSINIKPIHPFFGRLNHAIVRLYMYKIIFMNLIFK